MRLEKFQRRLFVHLRRHDALKIRLKRKFIYRRYLAVARSQEYKIAREGLFFLLLPMKAYPDSYSVQGKGRTPLGKEANLFPL